MGKHALPDDTTRSICLTCGLEQNINKFATPHPRSKRCDDCTVKAGRSKYLKSRDHNLGRWRNRYRDQRAEVISRLGGKCTCCGEDIEAFLTVDHIDPIGSTGRVQLGQQNIYSWLVYNNFPDGFRLLCSNCNHGRHRNGGICPHQEGSSTMANASSPKRGEAPNIRKDDDMVTPEASPSAVPSNEWLSSLQALRKLSNHY